MQYGLHVAVRELRKIHSRKGKSGLVPTSVSGGLRLHRDVRTKSTHPAFRFCAGMDVTYLSGEGGV